VTKFDCVNLLSGGIDSTTALAVAVKAFTPGTVLALSFNYGQRHRDQELQAARDVASYYGVEQREINLSQLRALLGGSALTDLTIPVPDGHYTDETMRITVVPNRNSIMLSIAFGVARAHGATTVMAGMHAGDHAIYPDCRIEFVRAFQTAMDEANSDFGRGRIHLSTPFLTSSKDQIVETGARIGVPYERTYSCYKGRALHCGTCGTCVERREAFELAHVPDPTRYALPLSNPEEVFPA
jgi:7-cyano-7-deazaguanine synthase